MDDSDWGRFLDEHPELRPPFSDEDVLAALGRAVEAWDRRAPDRRSRGWVFSSCVAGQLLFWPSHSEVMRVMKALGRLEGKGLVEACRPRHCANRWRPVHA